MSAQAPFDPLLAFAGIERLVSRIYYRFSHLFLDNGELRDFWWEIANYEEESIDPMINQDKARELELRLRVYLARGTPSLSVDEAFKIALEIENSEIDVIYGKLLQLGGPQIGKTMENLGVPASVQRQKLKAALRQYCSDPQLLRAAEQI
jgi:hypothetical protein